MKIIIFAGGIGTRLWPLSRQNSPKQFDRIFNKQSTLELAVERVAPVFGLSNIFIQTTPNFKKIITKLIPGLPAKNLIIEPARRNLAAAVCLSLIELDKRKIKGPVALLWADHLMKNKKEFIKALKNGKKLIEDEPYRFIFLAEKPRFANNNLGWIHLGKKAGILGRTNYYQFRGWQYRPDQKRCDAMFKSKHYYWNPGYFISSVEFLLHQYKRLAPDIYQSVARGHYKNARQEHFDKAIIEKTDLSHAVVLKTNMGWSDPGTLYALKEALSKSPKQNIIQGQVFNLDCQDCLIYNLEKNKLVSTVGLKGTVVVNTRDAIIVVPKDKVREVTQLLKKLEEDGLKKYL
jgi:mannose-1-phosphate guanylyltransferase